MAGHIGRIPNFGKSQVNPMGNHEPPACIQNAMMTKDKKPFTYTPGGLDLSQIKTPSMARRMARQRSLEEQEQAYGQQLSSGNNYSPQGVPPPPPPPSSQIPAPPPPPPLIIEAPKTKSPKPLSTGERPEIVIPENPIGMLRKTHSPYHWENEQAELQRMGAVPKFMEKAPSPLTVKMPPSSFSQQPPQTYSPYVPNAPNNSYGNQNKQPESPIFRPEAQYANSPNVNGSPLTRELLQRQDSQFNKSPQPFAPQSPISNGSTYSPTPGANWKQPERRDSPASKLSSPKTPQQIGSPFSPNTQQYSPGYQSQRSPPSVFSTLPRTASKQPENNYNRYTQENNAYQKNIGASESPKVDSPNLAPWRTNRLPKDQDDLQSIYHNSQKRNQQASYTPPWVSNGVNQTSQVENNQTSPPWVQENKFANQQQQQAPRWPIPQDSNNNVRQENYSPPWKSSDSNENRNAKSSQPQEQPRYQSTMSIPVTPRKQNPLTEQNNNVPQKEAVYVNQEPVYYCPESPKTLPPWFKTQKEKTKTPPPIWCQRPLEPRKSLQRELETPPRETNQEPEWIKKRDEIQRNAREVISPPKYQQPVQPTWSTRPSENRKSLPKDSPPVGAPPTPGTRVIPIQMEVTTESRDHGGQGRNQQPPLRIVINMQSPNAQNEPEQTSYSQPTQRIMRVLSPQLVRLDDATAQHELPQLNKSFQNNQNVHFHNSQNTAVQNQSQNQQPKTRIIPIQIEGSNDGANKRVYLHKFVQEGPPRQSRSFRVLQVITGTQDTDDMQNMENNHGFTDL